MIVGAGTAGCVLANRLSADPEKRVLLVEAGGNDDYFWINIPVGYLYTIGNPRTDWCFETVPQAGLNGRSIGYARGKVLGGCSSINAMIYMRGQASDYDHWAQLGNRGWSWDDVLPIFKRTEDYQHGADAFHGANAKGSLRPWRLFHGRSVWPWAGGGAGTERMRGTGPAMGRYHGAAQNGSVGGELRVEERRVNWPILDAWRDAAEQCGIPKIVEFNRGDNLGTAYFQMNQRRGVRVSASKAFLRPAMARPNLTVMTDALVERVQVETEPSQGKRATGITLRSRAGRATARAHRETILAAGAVGSPHLLQLSGIGPPSHLATHGIDVAHPLPGVGANLHDHLQIRSIYKVSGARTLNGRARSWFGKALMAAEYALLRTGPLTMPPSQLGAFAKSDGEQASANIEWHVQPLSLDRFGEPLHRFDAITPSVCNLRPTSRGEIRLASPDPETPPIIDPNYLATPEDRRIAVEGLRFTRRIMAAPALAKYQPVEWLPGAELESEEELTQAAADLGATIFHPVGTCRMGRDDMAVVDDRLRVHGIDGLRVIDASIMPRITSGNTNAPTVMIAEQGSDFVRADGACA